MILKQRRAFLAGLVLLALLALPASAAALGQPDITPETTMKEVRANPSIAGSGIYTYGNGDTGSPLLRRAFENQTLAEYVGAVQAEDCAAGLNLAITNYNAGRQVTYQVYSPEEIAENSALGAVQLFYFPAEAPGTRYAIVLGGNAITTSGELREGVATVPPLHEAGYAVFVLRYSLWLDMEDNGALRDLCRAVQYITDHAQEFDVQTEDYAVVGFSSGGQLSGVFGSQALGYAQYGLPRPGALLLGYPVNDFFEIKPVYHFLFDTGSCGRFVYEQNISDYVTADYPPTYHWYGQRDWVLGLMNWWAQGPALEQALSRAQVPHQYRLFADTDHAVGVGRGTPAENWLAEAIAFWEEQTAA